MSRIILEMRAGKKIRSERIRDRIGWKEHGAYCMRGLEENNRGEY